MSIAPGNRPDFRSAGELLEFQARRLGDEPFIRCGGDWVSYAALDEQSRDTAAGLHELGVRAGDRVAILAANSVGVAESIFACSKAAAVEVPLNTYLRGSFLQHQLADSGSTVAFVDREGYDALSRLETPTTIERFVLLTDDAPSDPRCLTLSELRAIGRPEQPARPLSSDLAAIMYTSGTTGPAKGCMIPHGMFTAFSRFHCSSGYIEPGDRVLCASPLFHMGCQGAMLIGALANDASICFVERFSASRFMPLARDIGATALHGVGAAAVAILAQPPAKEDKKMGLRVAVWVPLPADQADEFERRFGVKTFAESYGQTECMPISMPRGDRQTPRGSAGFPIDAVEVAVLDDDDEQLPVGAVGEIAVRLRVPNAMYRGYWNNPEASLKAVSNLWHHTGDLGRLDGAGFLWITDRKADALRRRGENVSSTELEAAIRRHAMVQDVAVHGVPSSMSEQDIKACIIVAQGHAPTVAQLFDFFRTELPYFAIPRYVEIVDEFPVNAVGRVRKDVLRKAGVTANTWDLEEMGFTVAPNERR